MKKITTLLVALLALFALNLQGQNAWINEFHYDNTGTDVNEFIEIILENPGSWNLNLLHLTLYNGSSGVTYGSTHNLAGFTVGSTSGDFTIYYKYIAGIQNGAPDGFCLSYDGPVIPGQFLSYEGSFTATNGVANGMTSVDVGVSEPSSSPIGQSLQLTGSGGSYSEFTWTGPLAESPGSLNTGQTISVIIDPEPSNYPTDFAAESMGTTIETSWTDATDAQLPSAYVVLISAADDIVAPVDGTPVADDLDLSDGAGAKNVDFGDEAYAFMNLPTNTTYYFAIYPYTNGGPNIDFKTDGTAPETTSATTSFVLYEDFNWGWLAWQTISTAGTGEWSLQPY